MTKMRFILGLLFAALCSNLSAADTNALVWHKAAGRMDADIRGEPLRPLLVNIARETGWRIYVEPGTTRDASAKFSNLPASDALRMLLGKLNFALVEETNGPSRLYVFMTRRENATEPVPPLPPPPKHVPDELLVKVKPGTDIDALARALGAKIIGRNDKLGIYRLQFGNAAAADTALTGLQNNSDVSSVDYNYYFDPPTAPQMLPNAPVGPVSLTLNPPGDSGRVIVGLIDTPVQPLDGSLNDFLLKPISVAGDAGASGTDPTHGTSMAETILRAISQAAGGTTSAQILPVDVYGANSTTTSWNVALGIQAAVDHGATVLNLSLAGSGDSAVLHDIIKQALANGIAIFAAAGNQPVGTPMYPAADSGVMAVTATQGGQLAPYANFGSFVDLALPGVSVVYLNGRAFVVQGTSPATATATGIAAGNKSAQGGNWQQIETAMQKNFSVPSK